MAVLSVKVELDEEKFHEAIEEFKKNNPDFVVVVRCKDCRFLDNISLSHGICYCEKHHKEIECDGYCSYGERKDDDE